LFTSTVYQHSADSSEIGSGVGFTQVLWDARISMPVIIWHTFHPPTLKTLF